jgi:hypothetical protein
MLFLVVPPPGSIVSPLPPLPLLALAVALPLLLLLVLDDAAVLLRLLPLDDEERPEFDRLLLAIVQSISTRPIFTWKSSYFDILRLFFSMFFIVLPE